MATASTCRSLLETPPRQLVRNVQDQGLALRVPASQRVATEAFTGPVHLDTHQPMAPIRRHLPTVAQHLYTALTIRPPQLDQPPRRGRRQVQRPPPGQGMPFRSRFHPRPPRPSQSPHGPPRAVAPIRHRSVLEPLPDPDLPPAVAALERRLETHLPRRHDHGRYPPTPTGPADSSQGVRIAVPSREGPVVIERSLAGQANRTPVVAHRRHALVRGHRSDHRPRDGQPALQRHAVANLHLGALRDDQALDDVEAVQLGRALGQMRPIPAPRRRRTTNPAATVPRPAPLQEAVEGAYGRRAAGPCSRRACWIASAP